MKTIFTSGNLCTGVDEENTQTDDRRGGASIFSLLLSSLSENMCATLNPMMISVLELADIQ